MVNLLKKALMDKKIPCYLTKPYKNYSLVSERSLYVLNHVCDFSLLNKIHNEIDKDGKARLVIVNKCIQIKSKLAQNKKDRFMLAFQSIFVNDSKYEEKTERPLIVER